MAIIGYDQTVAGYVVHKKNYLKTKNKDKQTENPTTINQWWSQRIQREMGRARAVVLTVWLLGESVRNAHSHAHCKPSASVTLGWV